MALSLGAIALRSRQRGSFAPFGLSLLGVTLASAGRFLLGSSAVMYGGIAILVSASVWNALPLRKGPCTHG